MNNECPCVDDKPDPCPKCGATVADGVCALPNKVYAQHLEKWHEDFGSMLWWFFPITEDPYVGSPLDTNWPGYHTHWTPFQIPNKP